MAQPSLGEVDSVGEKAPRLDEEKEEYEKEEMEGERKAR